MTSFDNIHDPDPNGRWWEVQLAKEVWGGATAFVKDNRDHVIFNGCGPLDSWTGLNERRIVLVGKTAKAFSDVLGCKFADHVDGYDDTEEGRKKRKRGRDNLKTRMKHALEECKKRLSAVTYKRIVMVSGVQHKFVFNSLSDKILNVSAQYYDAHRDNEAFADVTKEQGLVNLLSLPIDQFNDTFDGQFEINDGGFVESKDCVKEYFTKLVEQASTTTAPLAAHSAHQHYQLAPLSVTPGPPHGYTPMLQPPITQAPATAASAQGLVPINLFDAPASHAKYDAIGQLTDALFMEREERLTVKDQVEKLAEVAFIERDRRLELQNQVDQHGDSIRQSQGDIHQLQMTQAKGAADFQELQKKVDEEAADKEELKNDVNEMKSMIEVLTLTSQKQKKRVVFAPANVEHEIPARDPEKKKEPDTPKKKHESNPPTSNTPVRRSKRNSASRSGM